MEAVPIGAYDQSMYQGKHQADSLLATSLQNVSLALNSRTLLGMVMAYLCHLAKKYIVVNHECWMMLWVGTTSWTHPAWWPGDHLDHWVIPIVLWSIHRTFIVNVQ